MGTDRVRVLVLASVSVILIVTAALVLDWFEVRMSLQGGMRMGIDLRSVHGCDAAGVCVTVEFDKLPGARGNFPTYAAITFWTSLAFAAIVAFQGAARVLTGTASASLTRLAYVLGVGLFIVAAVTGYVFGLLDAPNVRANPLGITVDRTWAPALMLIGSVVGLVASYYATNYDFETVGRAPVQDAPPRYKSPSVPPEVALAPPPRPVSNTIPIPPQLRGVLAFATISVDVTSGGMEARREDGSNVLVLWTDIVGIVARRLPETYENVMFLDIVSRAGSTLRILPWTRLTGDVLGDGEQKRARNLIRLAQSRNANVKLDPGTRAFCDGGAAMQLPDAATLAAHDERLA